MRRWLISVVAAVCAAGLAPQAAHATDGAVDRREDTRASHDQRLAGRRGDGDLDRTLVRELAAGQGITRFPHICPRRLLNRTERREPHHTRTHRGYRKPRQHQGWQAQACAHLSLPPLLGFSMHVIDFSEFTSSTAAGSIGVPTEPSAPAAVIRSRRSCAPNGAATKPAAT